MATDCTHLDEIRDVTPSGDGCKECLEMGDSWVHLRECLICGHIGCCDNSKNRHATNISTPPATPSSSRSSRAKTGVGATWMKSTSVEGSAEKRKMEEAALDAFGA